MSMFLQSPEIDADKNATQTQACFNFDPRRAAGNQVLLFSCGGRADGSESQRSSGTVVTKLTSLVGGQVTNSQLFPFAGSSGPLALTPENAEGSCLFANGAVVDIASCNGADPNQSFTFGDAAASSTASTTASGTSQTESASIIASVAADSPTTTTAAIVTAVPTTSVAASVSVISVSRAGIVLDPSAVAEANPRDNTATRAFSSASIKSASGQCLFIDPTAGDFRENLIPIVLQSCDDTENQKWDVITSGVHNDQPNSALMVSTLTQGCLNFDPRRAAGDTVIMFSCGGRADGGGSVTNSQLFTFTSGETSLRLQPENGNGNICLVANASGRLDKATCSDDPNQVFTIA